MLQIKKRSGGFVFAEFAIALPLLILLMYGLAAVGMKIFYLGKIQLADYVLEEEVHDVLSRLIYDARAAKTVNIDKNLNTMEFTYHTTTTILTKFKGSSVTGTAVGDVIADKEETRMYIFANSKMYYKRDYENFVNPITGDNYFGLTEVTEFKPEFDKERKILHVTLEMESEISLHKIKISTAVYIPGCES
ncbi:MAG: hypothetical protein IJL12_08345 [Selenomonadaceae bacterium]|nr:hypothetical protein [Selenomonadaceae bacterium]